MAQENEPELTSIFNGKDFSEWKEPEKNIWWKIQDNMLTVKSDRKKRGSVLWTKKEYRDFIFQVDFRFGEGTIDSGVFIRTMQQQIQIGISGSLKRDMTCSPYIPGKGYPVEAEGVKDLLKQDDWNVMRIKAKGKVYTVWLNGTQVLNYESPSAIEQGPIGFQLHKGKEMAVDFRNIMLAELQAQDTEKKENDKKEQKENEKKEKNEK
jgi:hypothetical protein